MVSFLLFSSSLAHEALRSISCQIYCIRALCLPFSVINVLSVLCASSVPAFPAESSQLLQAVGLAPVPASLSRNSDSVGERWL